MSDTVEARVHRGVQFLNLHLGPDWPEFIDVENFNIQNGEQCLWGQTFVGGYSTILNFVSGNYQTTIKWIHDRGFTTSRWYGNSNDLNPWATLQEAWLKFFDEYEDFKDLIDSPSSAWDMLENPHKDFLRVEKWYFGHYTREARRGTVHID